MDILKRSGVQAAISPLHDRDLEADEQAPKKPHWHILMVYPGPKSYASMVEFCATFGGVNPIAIEQVRGYYRYLTHKDNPEKAQYDEREIQHLGGFSIMDFVEMTKSEVLAIRKVLMETIQTEGIYEYSHFLDWVKDRGTDEEFDVATGHTILFNAYLTSRRNALRDATQHSLKERLDNQQ